MLAKIKSQIKTAINVLVLIVLVGLITAEVWTLVRFLFYLG